MDKILLGHINQDTAFYVNDYPFGFVQRCRIRYWIETAVVGAKKGEMRFVSQTTNPKKSPPPGPDYWNKPKAGMYCPLLVMVQHENGHVGTKGLSYYDGPEEIAKFRKLPVIASPNNPLHVQNAMLIESRTNELELLSRKYNRESWAKYDADAAV